MSLGILLQGDATAIFQGDGESVFLIGDGLPSLPGGNSGPGRRRKHPPYWWEKRPEQETVIPRRLVVALPEPRPLNPVLKEPLPFTPRAQFQASPDLGEPEAEKQAKLREKRRRRAALSAMAIAGLYE